jgi:CBS domain-containing protein
MHAADVIEALPTARPGDDVLSALRMVTRHHLPGLVVANKDGQIIGCMSSTDLLQLTLPRYVREEPALARVYDEEHADHIRRGAGGSASG